MYGVIMVIPGSCTVACETDRYPYTHCEVLLVQELQWFGDSVVGLVPKKEKENFLLGSIENQCQALC